MSCAGLTIQNFNGEAATISGGVPLKVSKADWKPYKVKPEGKLEIYQDVNNVFGLAQPTSDTETIKYLGTFPTAEACEASFKSSPKGPFKSFTWHSDKCKGCVGYINHCYGVTDDLWTGRAETGVVRTEEEKR